MFKCQRTLGGYRVFYNAGNGFKLVGFVDSVIVNNKVFWQAKDLNKVIFEARKTRRDAMKDFHVPQGR